MHATPRCVLIDDDGDFLTFVRRILGAISPDFELIEFTGAHEAFEYFTQHRVDLIITDYRMPLMDGLTLIAAVRTLDREVPIIMMSGDDVGEKALAAGANVFVPKSAFARQLSSVLTQLGIHLRV
jgi:CheY-like chemotaxis protein